MTETKHPAEADLALFAAGDTTAVSRFLLNRHIRHCRDCMERVAQYELLRLEVKDLDLPAGVDWSRLSREMAANIHLGLEAGACVRPANTERSWNPRLAVAFASLLILLGAGLVLHVNAPEPVRASGPVLESTGSGIEVRTGTNSLMLLNHHGAVAGQTVNAQGAIRAEYIDRDAGVVTINNVYLE